MVQNTEKNMNNEEDKKLFQILNTNLTLVKKLKSKIDEKKYDSNVVECCVIGLLDDSCTVKNEDLDINCISDKYLIENNISYKNHQTITPHKICIYSSGEVISAQEIIDEVLNIEYCSEEDNISVHAIINNSDAKIYQTLPWDYKGNHQLSDIDNDSIGIVICEAHACTLSNDPMEDTFNSLVSLVSWLCKKYNISIEKENFIFQNEMEKYSDITSYWVGAYSIEMFFEKLRDNNNDFTSEELKNCLFAL